MVIKTLLLGELPALLDYLSSLIHVTDFVDHPQSVRYSVRCGFNYEEDELVPALEGIKFQLVGGNRVHLTNVSIEAVPETHNFINCYSESDTKPIGAWASKMCDRHVVLSRERETDSIHLELF
jgi:hypothetical protein